MIESVQKELQKNIPAKYYDSFFKKMTVVKMNDSRIVFGLDGSSALTVKKHIENKYFDQLDLAVANSVGKRKVELIVLEKIDTTKPVKQSDKIDYDGEVHKLESYIKENVDIRFNEVFLNLEHKPKGAKNYITWSDRDFSDLYLNIRRLKEYKYTSKDTLLSILGSSFIPTYHPIKDYFNTLEPWDEKIDWIGRVCSCLKVSNELDFRSYLEKWCIRSVYSLFSDNDFSNEHCLIIQSRQGWFKSTFINGLIPKLLKPYYNSRIPEDLRSKDLVVAASKIWIWFLDEIDKITSKREAADLRDFLSSKGSFQRAAYARNEQRFNRITNFIAACNKVEFLVDDTGNRRFIIFSLAEPIQIDKFQKIPMERFWAQVFHLYKNIRWNQIHWTANEQKEIQENNLQYEYSNNEYEIILKYFRPLNQEDYDKKNKNHKWMSATEIFLFIQEKHPGFKMDTRWIGRGLAKMKFEYHRTSSSRTFLVKCEQ
ncbi:MAG: VapE family protein [Leptospira sp.]|nr:VapE family protein [Leptospira sp.]